MTLKNEIPYEKKKCDTGKCYFVDMTRSFLFVAGFKAIFDTV